MSFGINARHIKCLEDYAAARTFALCAEKFKDSFAVPLDRGSTGMKKKHMSAVFDRNTEVVECDLYNTTMASYHPDGSIVIRQPDSVSDGRFLNALLPAGVHASNGRLRLGGRTWDDMRVYRFGSNRRGNYGKPSIAVRRAWAGGEWIVIDEEGDTEPWVKYAIDRKIAKKAWTYDKELAAFEEVRPMMQMMAKRNDVSKDWANYTDEDILASLLDESTWTKLAVVHNLAHRLKSLRLNIVGAAGGIKKSEVPFIPSNRERSWGSNGLSAYYNARAVS